MGSSYGVPGIARQILLADRPTATTILAQPRSGSRRGSDRDASVTDQEGRAQTFYVGIVAAISAAVVAATMREPPSRTTLVASQRWPSWRRRFVRGATTA
jgi:hypothetical protein